jgi:hypothetical protein
VTSSRLTILASVSRSRGGRRESSAETSVSNAAAAAMNPAMELPSAALRSANFRLQGSG